MRSFLCPAEPTKLHKQVLRNRLNCVPHDCQLVSLIVSELRDQRGICHRKLQDNVSDSCTTLSKTQRINVTLSTEQMMVHSEVIVFFRFFSKLFSNQCPDEFHLINYLESALQPFTKLLKHFKSEGDSDLFLLKNLNSCSSHCFLFTSFIILEFHEYPC